MGPSPPSANKAMHTELAAVPNSLYHVARANRVIAVVMTRKKKILYIGVCAYAALWALTGIIAPAQIESSCNKQFKGLARHTAPVFPEQAIPRSYYLKTYCPCPFVVIMKHEVFFTEHAGTGGTQLGFWLFGAWVGSMRLAYWQMD